MPCLDESLIARHVDGQLQDGEQAIIDDHLTTCSECRQVLVALRDQSLHSQGTTTDLDPRTPQAQTRRTPLDTGVEPLTAAGAKLDRYIILGQLGRGGMGEVYRAYDPELDRPVAIKLLSARSRSRLAMSRRRLQREAKGLAQLAHPNVVAVYDVGTYADRVFIVMELVEGATLVEWLEEVPRSQSEILAVFAEAGQGLAAAHGAGLIHRDFKPSNVIVGRDGRVRVLDFGLVRALQDSDDESSDGSGSDSVQRIESGGSADEDALEAFPSSRSQPPDLVDTLTRTGALVGTPAYMSPEQHAFLPVDVRTDQFSFCVSLYQALYRERPFPGRNLVEIRLAVGKGVAPPPPGASVPSWLRRVIIRGLAVDRYERWPDMEALVEALCDDPRNRWRRRLVIAVVVGAIAVLAAVVVTQQITQSAKEFRACGAAHDVMVPVWNESRRDQLRQAMMATGLVDAGETAIRVIGQLDDYASAWVDAHIDACEDTIVRREVSGAVLDLRMLCLADRRMEMTALIERLVMVRVDTMSRVDDALRALRSVSACADSDYLSRRYGRAWDEMLQKTLEPDRPPRSK